MEEIIKIENLCKEYKTYKRGTGILENFKSFFHRQTVIVSAVNSINLRVRKGSITGILGPNGAGKSTLIKMMTGVLFPTTGKIDVMGYEPSKDRKKYVQHIGAVFGQKSQLIWDISPADSFMMNAAIYDIAKKDYERRLKMMLELFELGDIIYKPTRVLSLGERMKCEFIMAKQKIRQFIAEMNRKGTTFILTTHDLEDVEQLAQEVIIINHGTKVFDGNLHSLKNVLGEKKIIRITLENSAQVEDAVSKIKGLRFLSKISELEYSLEADLTETKTPVLLNEISRVLPLKDISVSELPMEEVITKIYNT